MHDVRCNGHILLLQYVFFSFDMFLPGMTEQEDYGTSLPPHLALSELKSEQFPLLLLESTLHRSLL